MIRRILRSISDRLPCRIISDNGEPYLKRYYLGDLLGRRFYLHEFVGSDPARGLHDHPWRKAWSIVLAGWYIEERRDCDRIVKRFNSLHGDTFHRVVLPVGSSCWTLFFHTLGHTKTWGFLKPLEHNPQAAVFTPYVYPGGKDPVWWKSAPKGKDVR